MNNLRFHEYGGEYTDMEHVIRLAKDFVLMYGYCPTFLKVVGAKGSKYLLIENFPNEHEEKIICMLAVGKTLAEEGKIGAMKKVFLTVEGWIVKIQKDEPFIRPHLHPQCIETLVISCLDVGTQEQLVTVFEYRRDEKGNLIEVKEMVLPNGKTVTRAESPLLPTFVAG